ncbi:hypothetical protein J7T55_009739 [Diaporthe amygdali]|uniref:uncharacterized protein n=1 Tax=Phomopsis amygdali TaxID=1214568 RepID=UPI0022FE2904|nr:uncharacterized protein J7T55_009739 [Diaporthe amygdali]KAJ0116589.1 hypothetical protein J7T55_009739 [Diaporthe amygdali]
MGIRSRVQARTDVMHNARIDGYLVVMRLLASKTTIRNSETVMRWKSLCLNVMGVRGPGCLFPEGELCKWPQFEVPKEYKKKSPILGGT